MKEVISLADNSNESIKNLSTLKKIYFNLKNKELVEQVLFIRELLGDDISLPNKWLREISLEDLSNPANGRDIQEITKDAKIEFKGKNIGILLDKIQDKIFKDTEFKDKLIRDKKYIVLSLIKEIA